MDSFIFNYLNGFGDWLYLFVFIGMLIDGNIALLVVGFLLKGNEASHLLLIIPAFFGALTENLIWYEIGDRIKNHSSKISQWVISKTSYFDEHFIKRPKTTLLISKFIYGTHRPAIVRAGVVGTGIKKYIEEIIPVLIIWMAIFIGLGFGLKAVFSLVDKYLKYTEFILLGLFVLIILFQRFILSKKLKEKI